MIKDGGIVARPRTLGRGEAFGTAALLGEGGVHGEALVAVDTVRARMCMCMGMGMGMRMRMPRTKTDP